MGKEEEKHCDGCVWLNTDVGECRLTGVFHGHSGDACDQYLDLSKKESCISMLTTYKDTCPSYFRETIEFAIKFMENYD